LQVSASRDVIASSRAEDCMSELEHRLLA
jgi:hypothetical protein